MYLYVVIKKSENLKIIRINNYEKYNLNLKCGFVISWNHEKTIFSKLLTFLKQWVF